MPSTAHDAKGTIRTKKLIREAFEHQVANRCFSFVEVLSTCPTNWGLSPNESSAWVESAMIPYYPLGILKRPAMEGVAHA